MNKKQYEKPSVIVAELTQTGMLMASVQNRQVGVQNYNWQNEVEE